MSGHTPTSDIGPPDSRRGSKSTDVSKASGYSSRSSPPPPPPQPPRRTRAPEKVTLHEAEKLLLIPLFWRAADAQSPQPILNDRRAPRVLGRLEDQDLEATYGTDPRWVSYVAGRAARIDAWTREFLDAHPGEHVTVLHLACGLDCRDRRVGRDAELVRWVDVDRPLVTNLRERVMGGRDGGGGCGLDDDDDGEKGEDGEGVGGLRPVGDYSLRSLSVTEGRWYSDIPADRPTLVVAEGLFPYLTPAEAEAVIRGLLDYFGRGQLIFDTVGSLAVAHTKRVNMLKPSGTKFQWGVDDARSVLPFHEKLRLRDEVRWYEFMGVEGEISRETAPPWFGPKSMVLAQLTSAFKDNGQVLRFDF
ncbi:O-methyltransferase [Diaporthe amygdali]|uniref:O-methyltransferase n=1 Tax=Phomopsis amygdali TaxID=1214568 RepID=UPI0022FF45D4|nr:O-methyltransferase [Diaporthe amygdali]KAJ0123724.1 O-methyltransferase [Diaporthe amygdali]